MRLIALPSYPTQRESAMNWLKALPTGSVWWVNKYPFDVCIMNRKDELIYKLLFEI